MLITQVNFHVKPEQVDTFKAITLENARNSVREPGIARFDFVQQADDPTRFMLYEVYRRKEDFAAHQQTPHYFAWRDAVADWMAQPRQASKYNAVFFGDGAE